MGAAARQSQNGVTRHDVGAVNDSAFLDRADSEAGKVVLSWRIHAGHFCGFAADQCATGQFASRRNALHNLGGGCHVELSAGEVVKKEQWFGTLHQDVVHAHRDQIDTDRIVSVQLKRELELGADAVGA